MRIGVLGVNSKLANLQLREKLAKVCQKLFAAYNGKHDSHCVVLLSTCNRTELYFSSDDLAATHTYILNLLRQEIQDEVEFDQKLYSYFGKDCFLHLCRVTTGLDSAILGETEIQGQVKTAYELAIEYIALTKDLHYLFQKALMVGKKSRHLFPTSENFIDLKHAIFCIGTEYFREFDPKILFIGASKINCKVLNYLKRGKFQSITLCNRTFQSARALADLYNIELLEWQNLSEWAQFDWIIFGTKCNEYLFTKEVLDISFEGPKLLMDLSVPRNVDPCIATDPRLKLLNIDQLNSALIERRQLMKNYISGVEDLTTVFSERHVGLFAKKNINVALTQTSF